MTAETSPTVRRRRLAAELRRLRTSRGLTMQQVADHLEITAASLSRIETGRRGVRPRDLRLFLHLYEVDEAESETLLTLCRQSQQRGWWQSYGDILGSEYATLIGLEAEATSIRAYEQTLVPGLLQTEPYARAVIEAFRPGDSREEIDRRVAVRMERQNRLTEDDSLRLAVVLSECVTQQLIGARETTADQLRSLTHLSANVMVQVLPLRCGAHPALMGSFTIVSFPLPTDPDVVYLENMASALYVEDPGDAHRYADVFDRLRAMALSPSDSSDLLLKAATSLA